MSMDILGSIRRRPLLATFVVGALVGVRALVPIGYMTAGTGSGTLLPALSLCPVQNPGLASWLAVGSGHAHHVHAPATPAGGDDVVGGTLCPVWLTSADTLRAPVIDPALDVTPFVADPPRQPVTAPANVVVRLVRVRGPPSRVRA